MGRGALRQLPDPAFYCLPANVAQQVDAVPAAEILDDQAPSAVIEVWPIQKRLSMRVNAPGRSYPASREQASWYGAT